MKRSRLPRFIIAIVLVFFYSPIVVLMANSFNASRFGGTWEGFTWKWYQKLWENDDIWSALQTSLEIALLASVTSMLLGTLAAFALHRFQTRLQRIHLG